VCCNTIAENKDDGIHEFSKNQRLHCTVHVNSEFDFSTIAHNEALECVGVDVQEVSINLQHIVLGTSQRKVSNPEL
jgi:hypothetical protein